MITAPINTDIDEKHMPVRRKLRPRNGSSKRAVAAVAALRVDEAPAANARAGSASLWLRALSFLAPYWWALLAAMAAMFIDSAINLLPPLLVSGLIDKALPAGCRLHSIAPLLPYILALVLIPAISCINGLGQDWLLQFIGNGIQLNLRDRMFRHLQNQSLRFFTSTPAGEIASRVSDDVGEVRSAISGTLPGLAATVLQVFGTVSILFWVSRPLALAACLVVPFFLLPIIRGGARQQKLAEEAQERHASMMAQLQDVLNAGGYLLMRLFNRREYESRRFAERNVDILRQRSKLLMSGRWMGVCFSVLGAIGPAAIYAYGGLLVIRGQITTGAVVAFVAYLTGLYGPVMHLAGTFVGVQEKMGVFRRIAAILDRVPDVRDRHDAVKLSAVRGEVEFEKVTFAYDPAQPPALKNISFRVRPGQLVALVGPSGAGKTSAVNLVARFYDAQSGAVRIDGRDVRRVTQDSLLDQIAMVTQETYLFHDTIRANLLYARPEATSQELEAACRAAQIHDAITALPDGYETVVGERGAKLSGGQRQRLAIARALLKDPRILILDEATSALDSTSERLIQHALVPLMQGRTTIAIAHRLSTILAADLILVLDGGKLVESGSHEELLGRSGLYARLYREQFESRGN